MAGPQTTREALLAELLGDVGTLLDRVEAIQATLPQQVEDGASRLSSAGESAAVKIATAADQARSDFTLALTDTLKGVQKAATDAEAAAAVVSGAVVRFALLALLTGLAGGAIAGFVVAGKLFGG